MRPLYSKTFLAIVAILVLFPSMTFAGALSVFPASGSFEEGKNYTVRVMASSPEQAINAVSGTLRFPVDKLRVVSLSKGESILTLWVQEPSFSNSSGSVSFEGVVPNPGFTGYQGNIVTITFKAIVQGSATVKFDSGSMLANDGAGTNVAQDLSGGVFTVTDTAKPLETVTPEASVAPVIETPVPVVTVTVETPEITPPVSPAFAENSAILIALLIAFIAIVGIILIYLRHGFLHYRKRILRDTRDAESYIHKEFDELREAVLKELLSLGKARTRKDLSDEQSTIIERINKHIGKIEKNIHRKVEAVKKDIK